jgi:hypothetical protein
MRAVSMRVPVLVLVLVLVLGGFLPSASALEISCHIHPPSADDTGSAVPGLIGPFADEARSQSARQRLFGLAGRCHCVVGFAAPPSAGPRSFDAPESRRLPPEGSLP